jgi:hypothetical protein
MRETPDRQKTVLAVLMVGALFVTIVGGFVGIARRAPQEGSPVIETNNQLLLGGYSKLRNVPAPMAPETAQGLCMICYYAQIIILW